MQAQQLLFQNLWEVSLVQMAPVLGCEEEDGRMARYNDFGRCRGGGGPVHIVYEPRIPVDGNKSP